MILRQILVLVGLLAAAPLAAAAPAAPAGSPASPIELVGDVKLDKVTLVNGREKHELVKPDTVIPGNRVVFTTRYRNTGKVPVTNFVVTNPVPSAVAVTSESAASLVVSVDGGKTWGAVAALSVDDGNGGKRPAQSGDITHIRWTIPSIAPGGSGALTYNAIVR